MFYPVTVFPEVWLLSHWNESPGVRKSHQVIKYLSSWGSPGTAQTSPFEEGTPGPPQGGHPPPPHQSCPYVVLLITAVKRQNHPCPEHRQQWNNGGGGGRDGHGVTVLFGQREGRDSHIYRALPLCLPSSPVPSIQCGGKVSEGSGSHFRP